MSTNENKTNFSHGKKGEASAAKDNAPQKREGSKHAAPQTQTPTAEVPMGGVPKQPSAYEAPAMPAQPQPVDEIHETPQVAPVQKETSWGQNGGYAQGIGEGMSSAARQAQTNGFSMLDPAVPPTQTTQPVKSTPKRSMKEMREARRQQKIFEKAQREEARKVELFIRDMEHSLQTVQKVLGAIEHWKPLFNLETELFFMPQTLEEFKKYDAQIGDLQRRLEDCSHALEQSQTDNKRLEKQLRDGDALLRQLRQDIVAAQEENKQLVDQLQQKTQQYDSMLTAAEKREQSAFAKAEELQKDNAHIRKWIIENAGLENNEAASQAFIREIESFRYAVETVSAIHQICANIEQFNTYEALRLRVNQIMGALAFYRKKTGK